MKIRMKIGRYLILILGLIGYTLSGLNWSIGIAAWIAPIFLLYFTKHTRWPGFLLFVMGMALSAAISKTAENLSGLFIIYVTTGLSHGIINSIPYLIEKLLVTREKKFYSTIIFPSAIVFIEYLLSFFLGIWGNPSIAQYHNFNLIQITSVFGIFGISFLVAWFASIVNWIIKNEFAQEYVRKGLGVYGAVFVTALLYGGIRTNLFLSPHETVKVAAVISETDIHKVFKEWENQIIELSKDPDIEIPDSVFSSHAMIESQIEKTNKALKNKARIVVWNEISLILKQSQQDSIILHIGELCKEYNAYVLIAFLEKDTGALPMPFNNKSILITTDGEIGWEYRKSFLSPFEKMIINKGDFSIPFLDTEYGRIGNLICSDLDFSRYVSQVGKKDIDILLVPAFDWTEITPYHSNMAAFSAIQYGTSIIRANGKGIVAFYDYLGDTEAKMNTFLSDSKTVYSYVPTKSSTTIYSLIGNIFVYVLILFLLLMLGLRFKKSLDSSE